MVRIRIVNVNGIPVPVPVAVWLEARALAASGLTSDAIARRFHLSLTAVLAITRRRAPARRSKPRTPTAKSR
jgi:hypothetical protein